MTKLGVRCPTAGGKRNVVPCAVIVLNCPILSDPTFVATESEVLCTCGRGIRVRIQGTDHHVHARHVRCGITDCYSRSLSR